MAEGLQSFGGMPLGLLSQSQLGQLQSSWMPNQGQYGQALPADYKPLNPKPGDAYDPYYNLRMMMPGLLNNPNFSWMKSMNLQPMEGLLMPQMINSANYPGPAQPESPLDNAKQAFGRAQPLVAPLLNPVNTVKKVFKKLF